MVVYYNLLLQRVFHSKKFSRRWAAVNFHRFDTLQSVQARAATIRLID